MPVFGQLDYFVLIVGNARSGSTLLGSIIDAHPCAVIGNETMASQTFWRGLERQEILGDILANSKHSNDSGRMSEGYSYAIDQETELAKVRVMGDKVWNPAILMLHGDAKLIGGLKAAIGAPVKFIHAIRNPFDVVATMHGRSGASLSDRAHWYFMHCDAAEAVRDKSDGSGYVEAHLETLLAEPDEVIPQVTSFLGLEPSEEHLAACKEMLFKEPRRTRYSVAWDEDVVCDMLERMKRFDFLHLYLNEDYAELWDPARELAE
jgi:hypothetical protein